MKFRMDPVIKNRQSTRLRMSRRQLGIRITHKKAWSTFEKHHARAIVPNSATWVMHSKDARRSRRRLVGLAKSLNIGERDHRVRACEVTCPRGNPRPRAPRALRPKRRFRECRDHESEHPGCSRCARPVVGLGRARILGRHGDCARKGEPPGRLRGPKPSSRTRQ